MAMPKIPDEQRFVLFGIDWSTYVALSDSVMDRPVRFTFDGTNLELRTLSFQHEHSKNMLDRLLFAVVEAMDIDMASGGSMTCRRVDVARGLEPDRCYWIEHEPQVRGRMSINLETDPIPDLFLEIEITRSYLNRVAICAKLGVPEVWRWDGHTLRVVLLGPDGKYIESECTKAFPFLPMKKMERFLKMAESMSETKLLKTFRAWVREKMARGWAC